MTANIQRIPVPGDFYRVRAPGWQTVADLIALRDAIDVALTHTAGSSPAVPAHRAAVPAPASLCAGSAVFPEVGLCPDGDE